MDSYFLYIFFSDLRNEETNHREIKKKTTHDIFVTLNQPLAVEELVLYLNDQFKSKNKEENKKKI